MGDGDICGFNELADSIHPLTSGVRVCSINAVRPAAAKIFFSCWRFLKMRAKLLGIMAGGLILAAVPMLAHHSFSAEYDRSQPIQLKGTVTKVEWMNPHA